MSKSDIVLCYMDGLADQDLLDDIRRKLSEIHVEALTMAQESLAEALVPHKWLNPFPKVRYTEPVSYTHLDVYKRQGKGCT